MCINGRRRGGVLCNLAERAAAQCSPPPPNPTTPHRGRSRRRRRRGEERWRCCWPSARAAPPRPVATPLHRIREGRTRGGRRWRLNGGRSGRRDDVEWADDDSARRDEGCVGSGVKGGCQVWATGINGSMRMLWDFFLGFFLGVSFSRLPTSGQCAVTLVVSWTPVDVIAQVVIRFLRKRGVRLLPSAVVAVVAGTSASAIESG